MDASETFRPFSPLFSTFDSQEIPFAPDPPIAIFEPPCGTHDSTHDLVGQKNILHRGTAKQKKLSRRANKRQQIKDFYQGQVVFLEENQEKFGSPRSRNTDAYSCQYCRRVMVNQQGLQDHLESHHLPVNCAFCYMICPNKAKWRQHVALVHPKEAKGTSQVFPCVVCGRVLAKQSNLDAHKKSFHDTLPCEICGIEILSRKMRRHLSNCQLEMTVEGIVRKEKKNAMTKGAPGKCKRNKHQVTNNHFAPQPKCNCDVCGTLVKINPSIEGIRFSPSVPLEQNVLPPDVILESNVSSALEPFWIDKNIPLFEWNAFSTYQVNNGDAIQLELVNQLEVLNDEDYKNDTFEEFKLWSDGEIVVAGEEVVDDNSKTAMESSTIKLSDAEISSLLMNLVPVPRLSSAYL